jgi:hypothetical protein
VNIERTLWKLLFYAYGILQFYEILYVMCIVSESIRLSMQLNELDLNTAALDPEVRFIQKI